MALKLFSSRAALDPLLAHTVVAFINRVWDHRLNHRRTNKVLIKRIYTLYTYIYICIK